MVVRMVDHGVGTRLGVIRPRMIRLLTMMGCMTNGLVMLPLEVIHLKLIGLLMKSRMTNGLVSLPLEVIHLKMFGLLMMGRMTNGLVILPLRMTALVMVA